jgi:NADP-dependent 3-hydroxy acid dehydrogenase YdfG
MKGKTICITGAGGVLGRAVARATEPRGAVVALAASAVQGRLRRLQKRCQAFD